MRTRHTSSLSSCPTHHRHLTRTPHPPPATLFINAGVLATRPAASLGSAPTRFPTWCLLTGGTNEQGGLTPLVVVVVVTFWCDQRRLPPPCIQLPNTNTLLTHTHHHIDDDVDFTYPRWLRSSSLQPPPCRPLLSERQQRHSTEHAGGSGCI